MSELQDTGGHRRGRATHDDTEKVIDPLALAAPIDDGDNSPVDLEAVREQGHRRQTALSRGPQQRDEDVNLFQGDLPSELEDDGASGPEPAHSDEFEFDPDYDDEESEFEPPYDEDGTFEPYEDLGHRRGPKHDPALKPAPKPKMRAGHHPPPPHEHGPGPKKTPGKKAPGKKVPGKKAPGPKKHPGHTPPPPHEHGPGNGPSGPGREPDFGLGPGADFGFGPGPGFGFGFGAYHARGRRRGPGPGRRSRRGDVRAAILTLLAERPMHGYEMIQEIAERTQDLWRPSPGSVYPTLQLLDDEGLIVSTESEGSRKLFELTDEGRTAAAKIKAPPWEQVAAEGVDSNQINLRAALGQLIGAVAQSAYGASTEQQQRTLAIIKNARREIYMLLAESD